MNWDWSVSFDSTTYAVALINLRYWTAACTDASKSSLPLRRRAL